MQQRSPQEEKLYQALRKEDGKDVPICRLYYACFERTNPAPSNRRMQMRLGSLIARLNKKLNGQFVKPGDLKKTYALQTVKRKA